MWFADIIFDIEWYESTKGKVGNAKAEANGKCPFTEIPLKLLFYGSNHRLFHLRVVGDTEDMKLFDTCVNRSQKLWRNRLDVAVAIQTGTVVNNSLGILHGKEAVVSGEGNENAGSVSLKTSMPYVTIDYDALVYTFLNWDYKAEVHLFYFRRLIDENIPLDDRWLNGYKLLEYHFKKEKFQLLDTAEWRVFIERFREDIQPFLQHQNQTLYGFIEQVRNETAHAYFDKRSEEERVMKPQTKIELTFPILIKIVNAVMNDKSLSKSLIILYP
jgi:hypothetical protein